MASKLCSLWTMWTRQASQLSAAGHLVTDEQKMIHLESPEAKTRKSFQKNAERVFHDGSFGGRSMHRFLEEWMANGSSGGGSGMYSASSETD